MTDDSTSDIDASVDIDPEELQKHIKRYVETDDLRERRDIETQVLAETVWKALPEVREDKLVLDEREVHRISSVVPDDALEAQRLLRRIDIQKL